MISICRYLLENANVPNEQANGLTAPFGGPIRWSDENKMKLASAQNLVLKDPEEQVKALNKIRG